MELAESRANAVPILPDFTSFYPGYLLVLAFGNFK